MVSTTAKSINEKESEEIEVSSGVMKMIETLKEIVGDKNHSNADIHNALKESGMEPNQAAQRLLNQDPFREVKRKRDKKKKTELNTVHTGSDDPKKLPENPTNIRPIPERNTRGVEGNHSREGGNFHRDGGNFRTDGGNFRKDGGNFRRDRGHIRRAGGNIQRGGGEPQREGGEPRREGGDIQREGGESRIEGGDSRREGGYRRRFRVGYLQNRLPGVSREFRVVRDKRINQMETKELKSESPTKEFKSDSPHVTTSAVQKVSTNMSRKGSTGTSDNQKSLIGLKSSQILNGSSNSRPRQGWGAGKRATDRKNGREGKGTADQNTVSRVQAAKPLSETPAATMASNSSAVGVYSSSTDPIHVPSPDSRKSSAIRAIKREVGVVGGRRQSTGNDKPSSIASSSQENPPVSSADSFQPFTGVTKTDQLHQSTVTESVVPTSQANRPYQNNQYSNKPHQQALGHQKASQPNKEWRPKSSHKSSPASPGIIGSPAKSTALRTDNHNEVECEKVKVQDKLSQINISENQNVVIPDHIRVPETERYCLTFGSFGTIDSSAASLSGTETVRADRTIGESTASLSVPATESSLNEHSGGKLGESQNDRVTNSTQDFPVSEAVHEHQLPEKKELPSTQNIEHYSEIRLVQENNLNVATSDSHQQQGHPELSNFAGYDPRAGYDMPYFRQPSDEGLHGQDLQSSQDPISSHNTNSLPTSTVAMMQQQQAQVAQMYPQLHVSHYANVMPYRHFLSPVYVPPMAMPGYSTNPAYPHPSTGSSYVLMPGSNSHLGGSGVKYGMQQYKPVPTGNPSGFGNFVNPTGYAMNAPGVVSSGGPLEDSSRIKYKDGNMYIPSPQAETSEVWVQNQQREFPGLQSTPYYNMPGQTPHAAFLPSHNAHATFNAAAAAQSSHMQFPGAYHSPQPTAMPNPHHLGPAIGSNVQVGVAPAAPGAPVGAYQQPQPGLSWTTNFGGV